MEHQQTAGHHEEHPPTTIRQYILIGLILAVITVAELYLTEGMDLAFRTLVGLLIFLSAIKFAIVVALFMHLRFDHKLFTRLFVAGLLLAGVLMISFLALFHGDDSGRHGVAGIPGAIVPEVFVADDHSGEEEPEDEEATEGEGGEQLVAGQAPAEFFAANCAACHGPNREGLVGPALTPTTLTQADDFYHDTIKNGRPGTAMPPWGGMLNDEDINHLVTFLKTVEP